MYPTTTESTPLNNVPAAKKLEYGPTFESTDDSSGSGGTNSPTQKMQSPPAVGANPERPDASSSFVGEYGPSRSLRITKRPAGPVKNKLWIDDDGGGGGAVGGGGPPGSFRTDRTSPPSPLGEEEEGGSIGSARGGEDDMSAVSSNDGRDQDDDGGGSAATSDDDAAADDDAFLSLQTRRFESMRNLGGCLALAPRSAAAETTAMAETPAPAAASDRRLKVLYTAAADDGAGGGTPETAPLSPYTPGTTTATADDASQRSTPPPPPPASVPTIGGGGPEAVEDEDEDEDSTAAGLVVTTMWCDESEAAGVPAQEYHRTRGNISFRTPQFARWTTSGWNRSPTGTNAADAKKAKKKAGEVGGAAFEASEEAADGVLGSYINEVDEAGTDGGNSKSAAATAAAAATEAGDGGRDESAAAGARDGAGAALEASSEAAADVLDSHLDGGEAGRRGAAATGNGSPPSPGPSTEEKAAAAPGGGGGGRSRRALFSSSNSAPSFSGRKSKRNKKKKKKGGRTDSLRKISSFIVRGGRAKKKNATGTPPESSSGAVVVDPAREKQPQQKQKQQTSSADGDRSYEELVDDGNDSHAVGGGEEEEEVDARLSEEGEEEGMGSAAAPEVDGTTAPSSSSQVLDMVPSSRSPPRRSTRRQAHETRPDLDRIRDPEGVGTATKLTPFSLWYDDAAVVNLDMADADDDDEAEVEEAEVETSGLLDTSELSVDRDGCGDYSDDDEENNLVGIARPSYGVPSRSPPRSGPQRQQQQKKKKSLSSDSLSFFFKNRRGRPAPSSAAAAYYDTESEEEDGGGESVTRSESDLSEVRSTATNTETVRSARMGIARPTRCAWDDDEDAYCGGSTGTKPVLGSSSSWGGSLMGLTTGEILNDVELGPLHGYMLGRAPDSLSGGGKDIRPVERTVHKQTSEGIETSRGGLLSSGLHSTKYSTNSLMKKGVDVAGVEGLKAFPLKGTGNDSDTKMLHTPSPSVPASSPSREEMMMSMAGTGASSLKLLQEMPPEDSEETRAKGAEVMTKRGRASAGAAPPSILMSSLAYSAIFNSDCDATDNEGGGEMPRSDALVEYGSKSASCSARNLLVESSCRDLVIPASSDARRSAMAQAAPSSRALTIPSKNALTVVSEDVLAVAPTSKIYILLIQPRMKIFELIQIVYYPSTATVGDLLDLIPANATEQILGNQAYDGLCRPKDNGRTSVLTDLDVLASGTADGGTANIYRGEILVAMPEGCTGEKCKMMANPILANKRFSKLLSKSDPLAPKTHRRRRSGRSPSKRSGNQRTLSIPRISSTGSLISISEGKELRSFPSESEQER